MGLRHRIGIWFILVGIASMVGFLCIHLTGKLVATMIQALPIAVGGLLFLLEEE